jgi:hypothetical protein
MQAKPPQIDVMLVQRGRPELVTDQSITDIPPEHIVKNKVTYQNDDRSSNKFLLDEIVYMRRSQGNYSLYALYTNWFQTTNGEEPNWVRLINPGDYQAELSAAKPKVEKISMLTYNVWFDPFFKIERYAMLLHMIKQSDADFVCLQEVI